MSGILTVMKKEFARFFGDRRMIIAVVLPAILIYAVYSFMGTGMAGMFAPDEHHTPAVFAVNFSEKVSGELLGAGAVVEIIPIAEQEVAAAKEALSNRDRFYPEGRLSPVAGVAGVVPDLVMVFPDDFDALVEAFAAQSANVTVPNIEIYFNSTDPNSATAYWGMLEVLDIFEASLANVFDINRGVEQADFATAADISATIISSMMPMLLMLFLFSGCMTLAPESIAGEKERGTLATLLVTPLGRSELAAGKIISLGILSLLSGFVTIAATVLALPNMMGGADGVFEVAIYSAADYFWLGLIIISSVLLFVTLISIISAFSRSVKEASAASTPLMFLVMIVGATSFFGGTPAGPVMHIIPVYNSVLAMSAILALDYSVTNVAIAAISNIVYALVGGFALTKMFNSERVMFSK